MKQGGHMPDDRRPAADRLSAGRLGALAMAIGACVLAHGAAAAPSADQRGVRPGAAVRLEICRVRGIQGAYADKAVDIPAGAAFDNADTIGGMSYRARQAGRAADRTVIRVVTSRPARIARADYCTTVTAELRGNVSVRQVGTAADRLFVPRGSRDRPGWPGDRHLVGILRLGPS